MGRRILITLGWGTCVFIIMALFKYFSGVDSWFIDTLDWVIPSVVGFFSGMWFEEK